mgnify:CR=1 FL=1
MILASKYMNDQSFRKRCKIFGSSFRTSRGGEYYYNSYFTWSIVEEAWYFFGGLASHHFGYRGGEM